MFPKTSLLGFYARKYELLRHRVGCNFGRDLMYSYVSSVHFFTYWPGRTLIKFIHFICWKHLRLMRTTECLQKFHLIFSCSPKYHQPINKANLYILITPLKLLNYLNGKRPSLWPIRENIFPQNNSLTFAIIHKTFISFYQTHVPKLLDAKRIFHTTLHPFDILHLE